MSDIIYNSRNYLGIIARSALWMLSNIYNSRNYLGIIALRLVQAVTLLSTIVEIT